VKKTDELYKMPVLSPVVRMQNAQKRLDVRLDVPDVVNVVNVPNVPDVPDVHPCRSILHSNTAILQHRLYDNRSLNGERADAEDRLEQFVHT